MASQLASPAIAERFTIGRVLSLSWHSWIACRWHVLAIVVPVAALRAIGGSYLYGALPKSLPPAWKEMIGVWISEGMQIPATACLAFAAVRWAAGQSMHPADVLRTSWHRLLVAIMAALIVETMIRGPVLLIPRTGDLVFVAAYLAFFAYAVGVGLIAFLLLPILMLERTSVAGALDRSIELSSGHRWRIVALTLLIWVMLSLIAYAYRAGIASWRPVLGDEAVYFIRFVRSCLTISVSACIPAAAYYLLRSEKQGPSPATIARVFD